MDCSRKLSRILPPLCQRCGKPEASNTLCPTCWGKHDGIDAIRSVFVFQGVIRNAIYELKYNYLTSIAGFLAGHMAEFYKEFKLEGDVMISVPLHEKRLRYRGYNHAEKLAREVSGLVGLPVNNYNFKRIKDAPPQARTHSVHERVENVKDAFSCEPEVLQDMSIILVDDVCTSGSTLEACAVALKSAGARRVTGFTLAREIS